MNLAWHWSHPLYQGAVRPGVVAAQPAVPIQVSRDRWFNVFGLLDGRGHDACCGLLAELRKDSPDGEVIRRRVLVPGGDDYMPFHDGIAYFRCVGQPAVFGSLQTGVFVVSYYTYAHQVIDGILQNSGSGRWTGRPQTLEDTLRLHSLQFTYSAESDDWEIIVPPAQMRQCGYEESGDAFCSLGGGRSLNHSLQPAVQLDDNGREFAEMVTLPSKSDKRIGGHGVIAPIRWKYNESLGYYQWTETGTPWQIDGLCGETSTIRLPDGSFLCSIRLFGTGDIVLARTSDVFRGPEQLKRHPGTSAPRTIYACGDGIVRMFTNLSEQSPYGHERNPLYEIAIHENLELSAPRIIADAVTRTLPWNEPFLDMGKYVELADGRALLLIRAIDRVQTVGNEDMQPLSEDAWKLQGVFLLETNWR